MRFRGQIGVICALVLATAGLATAAQPDLSGTWQYVHSTGQTTLVIHQSGNQLQVTVEGRNIMGFDELTWFADGQDHATQVANHNVTTRADWSGETLLSSVTRPTTAKTRGRAHGAAVMTYTWELVDDKLHLNIQAATNVLERRPYDLLFVRQ